MTKLVKVYPEVRLSLMRQMKNVKKILLSVMYASMALQAVKPLLTVMPVSVSVSETVVFMQL